MENTKNQILIIGDAHFKDNLSYSEYVLDKRIPEKKDVLDFIVNSASDCRSIVLMGDNLNSKNNSSETIKEFVSFIERFNDKNVYIIAGNHEKRGNGKSAIDFLKEVNKPNWHIIVTAPETLEIDGEKITFLPYISRAELGVNTDKEATDIIVSKLQGGSILFAHHAVSDTFAGSTAVNDFKEVILPKGELESRYGLLIAGHIHDPRQYGRTIITGSLFTCDAGEHEKFIWKVDPKSKEIQKLKVPCRGIHKVINPTYLELENISKNSIIKCVLTDRSIKDIEGLKENLAKFDAYILIEQYPNERKKLHFDEGGSMDFSVENLLDIYSKEKNVDLAKLMEGYELIK